ncbi:hypothetical protein CRM22_002861, partial [Opisthorchis felineus]
VPSSPVQSCTVLHSRVPPRPALNPWPITTNECAECSAGRRFRFFRPLLNPFVLMSGKDASSLNANGRLREIQASIAEGRMMLQVLRSLPASENNNAFISRFEELVSRLEKYKVANSEMHTPDIQSQLDTLREKQENIRKLLSQTAEDFQAALSPGVQLPGSSQQQLSNSAAELLSKFSSLVTEGNARGNGGTFGATANGDLVAQPNGDQTDVSGATSAQHRDASSNEPNKERESADSKLPTSASQTKWAPLFAIQVTKLTDLIEDSKRFESMVDRLLEITRRARLTEASQFLSDIVSRFHELQKSFFSLRDRYETTGDDSQQSDETRAEQLSGLQEFLTKLEQNMETTKECFFTVYHLVKTSIEQNMANGSLCEAPEDEDDDLQPPHRNATSTTTDQTELTNTQTTVPSYEASLEAQKAHLAALQAQTMTEREEIGRLLKQRDELAERLRTLRAAALSASQAVDREVEESGEQTGTEHTTEPFQPKAPAASPDAESEIDGSSLEALGLSPIMLAQLEAKRRELSDLRAQLALLRKAEQQMASLTASGLAILDDNDDDVEKLNESNSRRERSNRPSPSPASYAVRSCVSGRKASKHSEVAVSAAGPAALSVPQKLDTVTFQQPEVTDNTALLYENIREARIRLEAERGKASPAVDGAETTKHSVSAAVGAGRASVATSHDLTTLATWGGSSPVASSSVGSPGPQAEEDERTCSSYTIPRMSDASQPNSRTVPNQVPLLSTDTPKSTVDRSTITKQSVPCPDLSPQSASTGVVNHLHPEDGCLTMPQLGRSPSPPNGTIFAAASATGSQLLSDESKYFVPITGNAGLSFIPSSTISVQTSAIEERLTRLEATVSQLCQLCRFLTLENQQLRVSTMNLLLHQGRPLHSVDLTTSDANALASGVLSNTSSVCPTPIGFASIPFANMPSSGIYAVSATADQKESSVPAQCDNLQSSLAQLMQQQLHCLQLQQQQFQRILQTQRGTSKPQNLQPPVPVQFIPPYHPSSQFIQPPTSAAHPVGFPSYIANSAIDLPSAGISWPTPSLPNLAFPGFADMDYLQPQLWP